MRELQEQLTSAEFAELLAHEKVEPRDGRRLDVLFAQLNSTIVNMLRDSKKGQPARPKDFLLDWWKESGPASDQLALQQLRAYVRGQHR